MSLHKREREKQINESLDGLIRWALQDSVADAEPSPRVWERIRQQAANERLAASPPSPPRRRGLPRRLWLTWLIGAGTDDPMIGDPRSAWQRRLHAFDMRGTESAVRIVEAKMSAMRMVA